MTTPNPEPSPRDPAAGALARALLRRELGMARLVTVTSVIAAGAAAVGYVLASRGIIGTLGASIERGSTSAATLPAGAALDAFVAGWMLRLIALPVAAGAAYAVMERIAADHERGWLPALVAGGRPALRAIYPASIVGGVALSALLWYAAATLAATAGLARGGLTVDMRLPRALPGVAAFMLAVATYGALWGVLLRRRSAPAAALAAAALPIATVAWWQAAHGAPPPRALLVVAALHLPALTWTSDAGVIGRQLLYAAVWLALLAAAAPRLVARYR